MVLFPYLWSYIRSSSSSSSPFSSSLRSSSFLYRYPALPLPNGRNAYTGTPIASLATSTKSSSRRRPRPVESSSSSSQPSSSPSFLRPPVSNPRKQAPSTSSYPPSSTAPEPSQLLANVVQEINTLLACTPATLQGGKKFIDVLEILHTLAARYIPFRQLTESSEFLQCLDALAYTIDKVPTLWETKYLARVASLLTRLGKNYGLTRQQERYYKSSRIRRILRQITLLGIQRMDKIPPAYIADMVTSLARANIRYEPLFQSIGGWLVAEDAHLFPSNYSQGSSMNDFWLRCDGQHKYRKLAYQRIHNYGSEWHSMLSGTHANTLLDIYWSMSRLGLPLHHYYPLYKLLFGYILNTAHKERLLNIEPWYTSNLQRYSLGSKDKSLMNEKEPIHSSNDDVYTAFRQQRRSSPSSSSLSASAPTASFATDTKTNSSIDSSHSHDASDSYESLPFTYRNSPVHYACKLLSSLALLRVPLQNDLLMHQWSLPLSTATSTDNTIINESFLPSSSSPSFSVSSMLHLQRYIEWVLHYPYGKEGMISPTDTELFTVTVSFCFYSILQQVSLLQARHIATILSNIHTLGIANTIDAAYVKLALLERMRTLLTPQEFSATNGTNNLASPQNYISVFAPGEISLALVSLAAQGKNYKYSCYPSIYRSFIPYTSIGILDDVRTIQSILESGSGHSSHEGLMQDDDDNDFITVKENAEGIRANTAVYTTESSSTTSSGTDWDSDNLDNSREDYSSNDNTNTLASSGTVTSGLSSVPVTVLPSPLVKDLETKMDLLFILAKDTVLGNLKNATPKILIQSLVAYTAALSEPLHPLVQYLCHQINTATLPSNNTKLPLSSLSSPKVSFSYTSSSRGSWLQTHNLDNNYLVALIWGLALNRKVEGPRLYPYIPLASVTSALALVENTRPSQRSVSSTTEGTTTTTSISVPSSVQPPSWYTYPGPIILHDSEGQYTVTNDRVPFSNPRKTSVFSPLSSSVPSVPRIGTGPTAVPLTSIQGTICTVTESLFSRIYDLSPQQLTTVLYSLAISGIYHAPLLSICSERLLTPKGDDNTTSATMTELDTWSTTLKDQLAFPLALMLCRNGLTTGPNNVSVPIVWNQNAIDLFFRCTLSFIPRNDSTMEKEKWWQIIESSGLMKRNSIVYITLLHLVDKLYGTDELSSYLTETMTVTKTSSSLPSTAARGTVDRSYQVLHDVLVHWLSTLPVYQELNLSSYPDKLSKEILYNVYYGNEALYFHMVIPRLRLGFIINHNNGTNNNGTFPYSVSGTLMNGSIPPTTVSSTSSRIPYTISNAHRIWQQYIFDHQKIRTIDVSDIVLLGSNGMKGKLRYLASQGLPLNG